MKRFLLYISLLASLSPSCGVNSLEQREPSFLAGSSASHATCRACHARKNPRPNDHQFVYGIKPSEMCNYCHTDYTENHHPVDFIPTSSFSSQFPLFEGEMKCLTCHEIHGGPELQGTPNSLRGGPFHDRREICFNCHETESYAWLDPHQMLDGQGGVRMVNGDTVCMVCHSKQPNPLFDETEDVRFRADVAFLCWRCHPPMPGQFFEEHFLVTPRATTLEFMLEAEERLDVISPLVPRGRITCSTCHNPHQRGVIWDSGAARGADGGNRLRLQENCIACHPQ